MMQRIELGLAMLSPSQKQAGALGTSTTINQTVNNPSTDGTNCTTEEALTSTHLRSDCSPTHRGHPAECATTEPEPEAVTAGTGQHTPAAGPNEIPGAAMGAITLVGVAEPHAARHAQSGGGAGVHADDVQMIVDDHQ